jgi:hypothetical protein
MDTFGRAPSTQHIVRFFAYDHLPARLQAVSQPVALLAEQLLALLPDSPELAVGLRKLLEAKDAFVRAALDAAPPRAEASP